MGRRPMAAQALLCSLVAAWLPIADAGVLRLRHRTGVGAHKAAHASAVHGGGKVGASLALSRQGHAQHARSRKGLLAHRKRKGVYMVTEELDLLKAFASESHHTIEQRFKLERDRLNAAWALTAPGTSDQAAVEHALTQSAEDYSEAQAAATEMLEYYYTAKGMLGGQSPAPSCSFLACGEHAKCSIGEKGARCECEPCYEGDGFRCRAVPCTPQTLGSAFRIRGGMPLGYPVVPRETTGETAELKLVVFGKDQLAVFVREISNGDRGTLILGRVVDTEVTWGQRHLIDPVLKTFGPVLAASPGGRLTVGFRDKEIDGVGYLMGGHTNTTGDPLQAVLSPAQAIAKSQVERMVLVQLQSSRVVCLYSEITPPDQEGRRHYFGGALLAEVLSGGPIRIMGNYRFAEGMPISRLAAVALTPSSFVVAFRAQHLPDAPAGQPSLELSAQWIGMSGAELVIDPHPVALEPEHAGFLDRDVALVAKDTFAYTYTGGIKDKVTKMAILSVDPTTHRMSILGGPDLVTSGEPQYIQSVSLPGSPYTPSTFTVLQKPQEYSKAEVCRISAAGRIADCREVPWADQELKAVSAARLVDGRIALAFIDMNGEVLYQLMNAQEHGAMLDFGQQ